MLDFTIPFEKYLPFIISGFLLTIALISASAFLKRSESTKSLLPILVIIVASSLTLYSIIPYLDNLTASTRSSGLTSVPLLTFGISPLGPRIRACAFKALIYSGVAIILSKSSLPLLMSVRSSAEPSRSAPTS